MLFPFLSLFALGSFSSAGVLYVNAPPLQGFRSSPAAILRWSHPLPRHIFQRAFPAAWRSRIRRSGSQRRAAMSEGSSLSHPAAALFEGRQSFRIIGLPNALDSETAYQIPYNVTRWTGGAGPAVTLRQSLSLPISAKLIPTAYERHQCGHSAKTRRSRSNATACIPRSHCGRSSCPLHCAPLSCRWK